MSSITSIVALRREFHRHPELGFLEYFAASRVAAELSGLPGCTLRVAEQVMQPASRMGAPSVAECAEARAAAMAAGADAAWVERFGDGLTGVVAEWKFPQPGPVVAFRFDLDALPVTESEETSHRPVREGFASRRAGRMHACGHDAHTAMGIGLAREVARMTGLKGTLRLIFQPAEEGCRGARSMLDAGVVADVDRLICGHLGCSLKGLGAVACGLEGWLATTKLDVIFTGMAAHAGIEPQAGRNALLAAATCALQLYALPRHGKGESRVNVGVLHAGTGRNIIADRATLQVEVRGATSEINRFMTDAARRVIAGAAAMHDVTATVQLAGEAGSCVSDHGLKQIVSAVAETTPGVTEVMQTLKAGGSEDATLLMEAVQARGGQATYLLVGTNLPAGHHQPKFDIDDAAMEIGVTLYAGIVRKLLG